MGASPAPASHSARLAQSDARRIATSSGESTRNGAIVAPSPTFTPMSGPARVTNASSSVRDVVAEIQHRGRVDRAADTGEGDAFVGRHEEEFADQLPVSSGDPVDVVRDGVEVGQDAVDGRGIDISVVHGNRCRLHLELDEGMAREEGAKAGAQGVVTGSDGGIEFEGEVDVELRAVTADEVDLCGQSGQRGKITQ